MPKKFDYINDNELDKLFRDAAENINAPAPPEGAWDAFYHHKMKGDKPGQKNKGKGAIAFFSLQKIAAAVIGIAGIAAILFYVMRNRQQPPTATDITINQKSIPKNKQADTVTATYKQQPDVGNASTKNNIGDDEKQQRIIAYNTVPAQRHFTYPSPPVSIAAPVTASPGKVPAPLHKEPVHHPPQKNITLSQPQQTTQPPIVNQPLFNRQKSYARDAGKYNNAGWQVSLVGGSNLSVISGNVSKTAGLNTGVMVQHRISKSRVSLETGVIRETMEYAVNNKDYKPNGQPVSARWSNIVGNCTMIDVPVNVRYDIVNKKKRNAFVSTGVSTTWMVDESYSYDRREDDGSIANYTREGNSKNNVYAVTNISAGYEQKFDKTSIQVAPYYKIPLGNVGTGNVNLGSLGAQVSIKRSL